MTPYPQAPLGEVVQINPGLTRERRPSDMTPVSFVPMAGVSEDDGCITSFETKSFGEVSKGYTSFADGDVLFAKITPCMENGKAAIARNLVNGYGAGSTEFFVLRPTEAVVPEFVYHFIRRPAFRAACKANFTGTAGQQRVPRTFLERVIIALPPLEEQRRIAGVLDRAAEIRRRATAACTKARTVIPALFLDTFGDPATNPKRWPVVEIGKLLERIDSGWSPRCNEGIPQDEQWGVLKLSAVKATGFDNNEVKLFPAQFEPRPELEVRRGDLLFTRKNTIDLVGTCAVVSVRTARRMLPDTIFRLVPAQPASFSPEYICTLINLPAFRPAIRTLASGSAASMPGISKGRLLKLNVPLPPLDLQATYADQVRRIEALAGSLLVAAERAQAMAAALSAEIFEP